MSHGQTPLQSAVQWINERLQEDPKSDRVNLFNEASQRFNLSPADGEFLYRTFSRKAGTH